MSALSAVRKVFNAFFGPQGAYCLSGIVVYQVGRGPATRLAVRSTFVWNQTSTLCVRDTSDGNADRATVSRSVALRATCLDEVLQQMVARNWVALRRVGGNFCWKPRFVETCAYQREISPLQCWHDAELAGGVRNRKSTSGGVTKNGTFMICSYSKRQAAVSRS